MNNFLKENLKNYWWYRFLIVVHVLVILFLLGVVVAFAWTEKPILNEYASTYQIKCNAGGVLRGDIAGNDLYHYGRLSFISESDAQMSRFVCLDSAKTLDKEQFKIVYNQARLDGKLDSDNFEIILKNPVYVGSWWRFLLILILGTAGVSALAWIAQSIFLYILIGRKPRIPLKRKQTS